MSMSRSSLASMIPNAILYGLALLLVVSDVSARPYYFSEWQSTYPNSTTDDTAGRDGCQVCHGAFSSQWNAYGNAVAALVRGGTLIGDAIDQVESQDADGQGESNLSEINANAQPGWTYGASNPIFDQNNNQSGSIDPISIGVQSPLNPPIPAAVDIDRTYLHFNHDGSGSNQDDLIPVVVFGSSTLVGDPVDLDTDLIDPTTLKFGPGLASHSNRSPLFNRDEDSDGIDDARFRFLMSDAAFDKVTCSDDTGTLTGELTTGETFSGEDTFISNCNAGCH